MKLKIKAIIAYFTVVGGMLFSSCSVGAIHTPLHDVAAEGDIQSFKALHSKRPKWVNEQDEYGYTPLYHAVENGRSDIAKYLIEHGSDVNLKNKYGSNAFQCVFYKGNIDEGLVKCFVEHHVDVNAKNGCGANVLHYGLSMEDLDVNLVKYLVKHGADVNLQRDDGCTPLHIAIRDKCKKVTKQLAECGADVNVKNKSGVTPLYYAVRSCDLDMVKCLVEHDADVNVKDSQGVSLLRGLLDWGEYNELYCNNDEFREGFKEIVDYLRSHGAKE